MQKNVKQTLFLICSLIFIFNLSHASSFEERKKAQMIQDLEVIKHHFEVGYAPAEWKKEYAGWDLNEAFEQSKNEILSRPSITTKQFQQILRNFVKTMKDYHVDVTFFSTERAFLPFSVKGFEGRYFIDWVDPLLLPANYYSISKGDELIEFDQQPIAQVMTELAKETGKSSNLKTDQAFTEIKLTSRTGMTGDFVPKGSILITTRSANTGKVLTHQLRWIYTPEHVRNPLDFIEKLDFISDFFSYRKKESTSLELPKISMANPLHQIYAESQNSRNGGLGCRKSFVPVLGEEIWSTDSQLKEGDETPPWYAYIYHHPQGYKIGYIRLPHYIKADLKEFGKIIKMMEDKTDALVIDQLHNFGGFVHIQYALVSMLTHQPLQTPYHRIKLTQQEVMEAHETLELIKLIELMAQEAEAEELNKKDQEEGQDSQEKEVIAINFQKLLFLKDFYELILDEWNQGQTLTRPTPILGVDKINPHPKYQYSKPIVMLINEMDFSGGDFVPAILQDNKRALLFGSRTAGAGGFVFTFNFPNTHGIAKCSYTASIAERTDLQKIENLGVSPDIAYEITLDDLQNGYRGYVEAVNQAVQTLLANPARN